jgi:predicted ATP-dependent protease
MLNREVRAAVAEGQFHVYAVATVEDGMHILTGATPDKVHKAVDRRLRHFADRMMAHEGRQP